MTIEDISRIHYGIHKPYVPIAAVEDHLRLGWMPLRSNGCVNPYRAESVHLVWPCRCNLVVPQKGMQ